MIAKDKAGFGCSIPSQLQLKTLINSRPASWESVVVSLNMPDVVLNMNTHVAKFNIEAQRERRKI